jgi:spore coat polysaccharide biosynthesis protein SpsF (cytidylyltransferase family)
MKKIIAIIQARMGARRLPGKILLNLEGKTVLERVIERVKNSRFIQEVIVATTIRKDDLKIVRLCSTINIRVYCGSENDVLDRYFQVSRLLQVEHIVRITADCPLIDPNIIDNVIRLHLRKKADYTSNTLKETFPDGEDVEVFTFTALKRTWKEAKLSSEREHVTAYIKKHPKIFKLANLVCYENFSSKRWTLDEKADYKFIRLVYKKLYKRDELFGMSEILRLLERHPEYERINNRFIRNEGYLKSLREDRNLKIDYINRH